MWAVLSSDCCTGHTQKNGAVSIVDSFETAPFFCVCPVYAMSYHEMRYVVKQVGHYKPRPDKYQYRQSLIVILHTFSLNSLVMIL
jgi:hypothetical protein